MLNHASTMLYMVTMHSPCTYALAMYFQLVDVRTSDEAVMTSTSNTNDSLANSYYTQMQNVKVAFVGLRQGGSDSLLQGGEPPSGQSGPKQSGYHVRMAHATVRVLRATGLAAADKGGTSDPYALVESLSCSGKGPVGGTRHCWQQKKTSVKKGTLEPEWDETLELSVYDAEVPLSLAVWDHDNVGMNDTLGGSELLLTECEPGTPTVLTLALSTQGSLEATPPADSEVLASAAP